MTGSCRHLTAVLLALVAAQGLASATDGAVVLFFDDFETDLGWGTDEEIVGPCYGGGPLTIGEVARTASAAMNGSRGLQVTANQAGLPLSDHVIGQFRVADAGIVAPLRYELHAALDPGTAGTTQTGPEFSVQVTHLFEEGWRTMTFGLQVVPSPHVDPEWPWQLWVESDTVPGRAEWRPIHHQALLPGAWYRFVLEADLTAAHYESLLVEGPGVEVELDLTGHAIAREVKFFEAATWVSVEGENLWSNCGVAGSFEARVWYDDVQLVEPPAG